MQKILLLPAVSLVFMVAGCKDAPAAPPAPTPTTPTPPPTPGEAVLALKDETSGASGRECEYGPEAVDAAGRNVGRTTVQDDVSIRPASVVVQKKDRDGVETENPLPSINATSVGWEAFGNPLQCSNVSGSDCGSGDYKAIVTYSDPEMNACPEDVTLTLRLL